MIYLILAIWLIGSFISYNFVFKDWIQNKTWENVWYACIWPLMGILYLIHAAHNSK